MYPFVFYECIHSCWQQEESMRPSAGQVLDRLGTFRSSLLNRYTLEAPSSLSSVTIVFVNHMQNLWAVMEYPNRSPDDPDVTKTVKLTALHQNNVNQLDINVRINLSFIKSKLVHFRSLILYHLILMPLLSVSLNSISG